MSQIRCLVFDVGGVLVELDWHGTMSRLLGRDIPFEAIHDLWSQSAAVNDFEHGRTDFETFTQAFMAEQQLTLTPAEFQRAFMDIIRGDFPGICDLLAALQPRFHIALLSNTNPAHWQLFKQQNTFLRYVDDPYTSLQFGLMKPNPAIYQKLIDSLPFEANEILFFDDGKANVDAAQAMGINASRVFGPEDIRKVLARLNLL